jgi:hypothetical protein
MGLSDADGVEKARILSRFASLNDMLIPRVHHVEQFFYS